MFASFGSYGIYAYDMAGELKWEVDLGDMDIRNSFGEGSTPVIWKDSLIVLWDHNGESFLTALDRQTGEEKWRTERAFGTNWTSPLIYEGGEVPQVIVASTTTIAYNADTGEEIWSFGGATVEASADSGRGGGRGGRGVGGIIATPIVHQGILIFSTGTRRGGTIHAISLDQAKGQVSEESEAFLWRNDRDAPRIPSPLAHGGLLYALKGSNGLLSAIDIQTGEAHYSSQRLDSVGDVWATPVLANEHLYILGRDGTVEVVTTGKKRETVAVNKLDDVFDASPSVAGNELFIRGRENLYCISQDK